MNSGDVFECLRNPDPARQHSDIGNEADIPHELIALGPGVSSEHPQFSLIRGEADETENPTLFHAQIDAVQRNGCTEGLTQAACFYACHGFIAPPLSLWFSISAQWISTARHPQTTRCSNR